MKKRLTQTSSSYLDFLETWVDDLPAYKMHQDLLSPEQTAVMVVDMINGFCNQGPLASPRVNHIIPPIVTLLNQAYTYGVRDMFLLNDAHDPEAVEFKSYPPHCIQGTAEAEPVDEIKALPFYADITKISKNSIASNLNTVLPEILALKPGLRQFIVVGNCTDLCIYQMAMYLGLSANAGQVADRQVIVPVDCVQTYDMDVDTAARIGAQPHPGDLLHLVFLHHMALNGINVVSRVQFA